MSKPLLVFQAPVATRSGYGDHARDLLKSFRDLDLYNIKVISTRWGVTPMDQLTQENEFHNWILNNIIPTPPPNTDVFVQLTVPNEFQRAGKINIGVTAGIETNIIPRDWVDGCNRMDLIITTSEHSKMGIVGTVYQQRQQNTNQVLAEFRVTKPTEVLFEGCDYKKTGGLELLNSIKEDFCFLFVGHWLQGDLYHDRKDVGGLVQTFIATFGKFKTTKPALILKTSSATFSIRDREEILNKIENIKKTVNGDVSIYLLHGDLSEEDMWKLYNHPKIKASVSFTHGEGFGRPLLEFSLTGKPILASNWSGHIDFLKDGAVLLDGQLKNVHETSANQFLMKESQWFYVNYSNAANKLIDVFNNYNRYIPSAVNLAQLNKQRFSFENMKLALKSICDKYVKVPQQVNLKLPQLPTLQKTSPNSPPPPIALPKLNLPNLKK